MKQISLITCALILAACNNADQQPSDEPTRNAALEAAIPDLQPHENVLIISFDALRADALGIYGYDRPVSPSIDAWAQDAVIFEQFYTVGQATPTSFAAAFTGLYPFKVFRGWKLEETQTLAKVMQKAGFRTIGVFNNVQLDPKRHFNQGFDEFEVYTVSTEEDILERARAQLTAAAGERFFAWIHFISPHTPYQYREESAHLYTEGYEGQYERTSGPRPDPTDNPADLQRLRELYDGEVLLVDTLFQSMLDLLAELELDDKTLVMLTSDHGEQFMEHGAFGHSVVYDEVIRIPFIVKHPRGSAGAVRVDAVQLNTDLLPTLAEIAAAPYVPTSDGRSLRLSSDEPRTAVFTAMTNKQHRAMGVRHGDDKLIVTCPPQEYTEKLYDLATDPGEQIDRALDDPDLVENLFDTMSAIAGADPCDVIFNAVKGVPIEQDLDEETIEKLRSLGYIQ